jgi:hypothetical protein
MAMVRSRLSRLEGGVSRWNPLRVCWANLATAASTAFYVFLSSFAYSARKSLAIARRTTGRILPCQVIFELATQKDMLDGWASRRRRKGVFRADNLTCYAHRDGLVRVM